MRVARNRPREQTKANGSSSHAAIHEGFYEYKAGKNGARGKKGTGPPDAAA
jgi:hypothetical protein